MMNPALRLASIAIGFCVYAGLAILGWAGFRSFFFHPALIALVAVLFSLSGLAFFAGGNLSPGVREARGNRWVIPVFVVMDWSTRICRHTPIAKSCGRLTVTRFAGSVSYSSLLEVHCGSGQCLCWADDSAAWWQFSRDIRW